MLTVASCLVSINALVAVGDDALMEGVQAQYRPDARQNLPLLALGLRVSGFNRSAGFLIRICDWATGNGQRIANQCLGWCGT